MSNFLHCFSATLVCFFNSLANGEYLNLFNAAAFSNKSFPGKTSIDFAIDCFDFLTNTHFHNKFALNSNGLSDDKVVSN